MKNGLLFLLVLGLWVTAVIAQTNAPSIQSGVTFQWLDVQVDPNAEDKAATLGSVTVNGKLFSDFRTPATYELTQLGTGGHPPNGIRRNGTLLESTSASATWDASAAAAFSDRNLNHYFEATGNGEEICDDFAAEDTTTAQRQAFTFDPAIRSSAEGLVVITERNANNCYHVELFGIPVGGGPEQSLGETFVNNDGTMWGYGGSGTNSIIHGTPGTVNPPNAGSDYWLTSRMYDNGGTIGVALFELQDLAPVGSHITKVQFTAATVDHGDGKVFIITSNSTEGINDDNNTFIDTPVDGNVLTNDVDVEGDSLIFQGFEDPTNPGSFLAPNSPVVTSEGTFTPDGMGGYTFSPATGFTGLATIDYQVCDDGDPVACSYATLTITVSPIPDPTDPSSNTVIANDDDNVSYGNPVDGNVMDNDGDLEGDSFSVSSSDIPLGTPTPVGGTDAEGNPIAVAGEMTLSANGTYVFSPCTGADTPVSGCTGEFIGTVDIDYTITDSVGASSTATLTIDVLSDDPNNDGTNLPFAGDDLGLTGEDSPLTSSWAANDGDAEDGAGTNLTLNNPPTSSNNGGTIVFNANGTYTYTPPPGYIGPDQVVYEVCDASGLCAEGTLYLLVSPLVGDWGDLPNMYPAIETANSPDMNDNLVPDGDNAVWLGTIVDYESSHQYSADAKADGNDEDGLMVLQPAPSYGTGRTAIWTVTVNGNTANTTVFFQLNIDWDLNGSFEDVYTGSAVTNSPTSVNVTINVPNGFGLSDIANVRLVGATTATDAAKTSGSLDNGEVEDYQMLGEEILPVELLDFQAIKKGKDVHFFWSTATEINNAYFDLEYSKDGNQYESLSRIEGQGTTTETTSYNFIQNDAHELGAPILYYRLKQVDNNGAYSYSDIIKLHFDGYISKIIVFPNPASLGLDYVNISGKGIQHIRLYDASGRLVINKEFEPTDSLNLSVSNLEAGMYLLQINEEVTSKLIVLE